MNECKKCEIFHQIAVMNGYRTGMCEECFNEIYVAINPIFQKDDDASWNSSVEGRVLALPHLPASLSDQASP